MTTAPLPLESVRIPPLGLAGILGLPPGAPGLVIFAHGSGSGRLSPRNQHVAAAVRQSGQATLLQEPGTLDVVVGLATDWFRRYLVGRSGG